jgi:putative protease
VSRRCFPTRFHFAKPGGEEQRYDSSAYINTYNFAGLILDYNTDNQIAAIEQKNRIFVGDEIEIFGPDDDFFHPENRENME